ncbi:tetratricopeptide repeat protein [Desulfonema magnum]|uniref:Tetratricopeptide repeat-containing protein n=1 Tax=Desulfonema magnum TaxID=45655 RepID=A0A975GKV7_9BACT|nr:hypothetical protein [Desulfonema magnum]QTA84193.1 Tetratricopeptide repeat-containing protein [Desulfonema magnum]
MEKIFEFSKINMHEHVFENLIVSLLSNYLNKQTELHPENPTIYLFKGILHFLMEKKDEAVNDFDKFIEFAPEDRNNYFIRGIFYHLLKKEEAINDFNKAIELDENPKNYLFRAFFHLLKEKKNEAVNDFDRFTEFFPEDQNYTAIRGFYHSLLKKDQAVNDLNKNIELEPENPKNFFMRGIFYLHNEKLNEAVNDFDKTIELEPENPNNYLLRGISLYFIKKEDEAFKDFEKSIELNPENLVPYSIRRFVHYMKGDFEESFRIFEKEFQLSSEQNNFIRFIYKLLSNINSTIRKKEVQLKTDIFQAVSHTISNIMLANKSITRRIKNGTSSVNDVSRLELLNDLVLSTMNAVKLAFSNENIVLSRAQDELFYEKIKDGISLHDLLWFCLNVNLYYLVVGEGEEAWATIRNIFFSINRYDKKDVKEKLAMLKEMRKSPHFSISELSHDQIAGFVNAFQSEQFEAIRRFFAIEIEALGNLYVKKNSYTFSVLFIILLELTKNMIRYGTIEDTDTRKFTIKTENAEDYVVLTLENVCQKSRTNFKESTLKGLAMIQEFSKVVGKFEQTEKNMEDSEHLEFAARLFIKRPEHLEFAARLFIKRPEHQETVTKEGM